MKSTLSQSKTKGHYMRKPEKTVREGVEPEDALFVVKDSELRRLLRLSNVQAYYDCRTRPISNPTRSERNHDERNGANRV
jgi:hypothetical protein